MTHNKLRTHQKVETTVRVKVLVAEIVEAFHLHTGGGEFAFVEPGSTGQDPHLVLVFRSIKEENYG